jgi:hypothetical protein
VHVAAVGGDGCLQDRVCGVEVPVGEVVADAGRVEDQPVGQAATLQVGADRVGRSLMSASRWCSR